MLNVEEIKGHLERIIVPFWQNLKDLDHGGYYSYLSYDLKLDRHAEKGCILNSRILWFFSNAYKVLKDEQLLSDASHAYQFFINHCADIQNGGVYWSLNYDGSVCDGAKHTYNQAFAIYALSSYYDVTKKQESLEKALELYDLIETKCRDSYGYLEAFDRYFNPVSNDKLSENGIIAEKTMNTILHVFEAYTELYRVTKDERVGSSLRWIMDIFAKKVYNPGKQRQEVFFDQKMNSILDLHSYGHDIETAWLIDRGCEVLGDKSYQEKMGVITERLTKEIYRQAFDGHSVFNECEEGIVNKNKIWWVQAESIVGFYNAYEKNHQNKEYLEAADNIWQFINEHLIDKREGSEWFWEVDEEGRPSSKKPIVEPWKCPYHNGRMCIEMIRRNSHAA